MVKSDYKLVEVRLLKEQQAVSTVRVDKLILVVSAYEGG